MAKTKGHRCPSTYQPWEDTYPLAKGLRVRVRVSVTVEVRVSFRAMVSKLLGPN